LKQARQSYEGLTFQPVAVHLQDESVEENICADENVSSFTSEKFQPRKIAREKSSLFSSEYSKNEAAKEVASLPDKNVGLPMDHNSDSASGAKSSSEVLDSEPGDNADKKKRALRGIRASRVASMLPLMPELPEEGRAVEAKHISGGGILRIVVQQLRGGIVGNLPPHLFHNHRNAAKVDLDVLFELDKGASNDGDGISGKHRHIVTTLLPKLVRRAEGDPERKASRAGSNQASVPERKPSRAASSKNSDFEEERDSSKIRDTEKSGEGVSVAKEVSSLAAVEDEDEQLDGLGDGVGRLLLGNGVGEQADVQARVLSQLLALNQEMLVVFGGREVLRLPLPNRAATCLEVTVRDRVRNLPLALLYLDVDALLTDLENGVEKSLAFDLEPAGVLALALSFEQANSAENNAAGHSLTASAEMASFVTPGFLVRKRAIRQAVTPLHGHLFVKNRSSFLPIKCALCRLFIWRNTCQACLNCSLRVHRSCLPDLYFICPKADDGEEASSDQKHNAKIASSGASPIGTVCGIGNQPVRKGGIGFDVPHQWKPIDSLLPSFCAYCGLMGCTLYCAACFQVAVHAKTCVSLLPRHCAIQKDMAVLLRLALEEEAILNEQLGADEPQQERDSQLSSIKLETKIKPHDSHLSTPKTGSNAPLSAAGRMKEYISALPSIQALMARGKVLRRSTEGAEDTAKDGDTVSLAALSFVAVLGRGNFGKVFLVQDATGKLWALKALRKAYILENDDLDALFSELQVFSLGNACPFLLHCEAAFQSPAAVFFLMPYIAGGDLMFQIQQRTFTPERARFYAAQVILALQYLHSHGILYRDLKLDNILLGEDGYLRIADYGLCKRLALDPRQSCSQQPSKFLQPTGIKSDLKRATSLAAFTRTFCGTPEFMAPEILCSYPYSFPVDFWAFGVLLYELMYGRAPFFGNDENQIFAAILQATPSFRGNGVPLEATLLIKRLLVKDPAKRLQSWDEVREAKLFACFDWDGLAAKTLTPPFMPDIGSDLRQPRNFDSDYLTEPVSTDEFFLSSLSPTEQKRFRDFFYKRH
jgi:serine/threonine protein kinase